MPAPPSTLEEEHERFYAALGKAITQWQHVEDALSRLYCGVFVVDDFWPASATYHTILAFEIRLEMVNAVLRTACGPSFIQLWNPLYNKASRRAKRRNQLAHFSLLVDASKRPGYRLHLQPSLYDTRAHQK
jgi:hypothetical protein